MKRAAYESLDMEGSRIAHDHGTEEEQSGGGVYVKSLVFGGLDGCCTAFALVCASQGASLGPGTTLIMGFANVVADGISMGLGDSISEKAEQDFATSEFERERWEFDNYLEGEVAEMREIFKEKGVVGQDVEVLLDTLVKYPSLFVEIMAHYELGIMPPEKSEVWRKGLVTFLSFQIFGYAPLLPYLFGLFFRGDPALNFALSILSTAFTLFALGYVKGRLSHQRSPILEGVFILANGSFAAGIAFLVGWACDLLLSRYSN